MVRVVTDPGGEAALSMAISPTIEERAAASPDDACKTAALAAHGRDEVESPRPWREKARRRKRRAMREQSDAAIGAESSMGGWVSQRRPKDCGLGVE